MDTADVATLPDHLARLYDEVVAAARDNPQFARVLVQHLAPQQKKTARGRSDVARPHRSRRRPRGVLDPFEVMADGEAVLRSRLRALDVERLKDIVAEHGMDSAKLALKWKKPERLVDLIVATVQNRLAKGSAFRSPEPRRTDTTDRDEEPAPVRRYIRINGELQKLKEPARSDALQDLLSDCLLAARALAETVAKQPTALSGQQYRSIPVGMAAAAAAAEELLSVGAALVKHDVGRARDEWLAALGTLIETGHDSVNAGKRLVLPPAAALAIHGAGALAWYRRRWDAVRAITTAQLHVPDRWLHHHVLGDSAHTMFRWVIESLQRSAVLVRADSAFVPHIADSAADAAGVVVLRDLISMSNADISELMSGGIGSLNVHAWPALYFPYAQWTSRFAAAFRSSAQLERDVAEHAFALQAVEFRGECKRVTPALARCIHRAAREENRSVHWGRGSVGAGWMDWCGGSA